MVVTRIIFFFVSTILVKQKGRNIDAFSSFNPNRSIFNNYSELQASKN